MVEKIALQESDFLNSVIYFGALEWCSPCKTLHPLLDRLSKKYASLNFIYVDADKASDLMREFKIMSVPTVKVFINGVEKRQFIGLNSPSVYEKEFMLYDEGVGEGISDDSTFF
jgi:thiol-disulfide isomerase/thioredoxin